MMRAIKIKPIKKFSYNGLSKFGFEFWLTIRLHRCISNIRQYLTLRNKFEQIYFTKEQYEFLYNNHCFGKFPSSNFIYSKVVFNGLIWFTEQFNELKDSFTNNTHKFFALEVT